jgi:hypothetical protein
LTILGQGNSDVPNGITKMGKAEAVRQFVIFHYG